MAASRTQMFGPGRAVWHRKGLAPRREEGREQRKDKIEKREERKLPPAGFTAFIQCPVPTTKKF